MVASLRIGVGAAQAAGASPIEGEKSAVKISRSELDYNCGKGPPFSKAVFGLVNSYLNSQDKDSLRATSKTFLRNSNHIYYREQVQKFREVERLSKELFKESLINSGEAAAFKLASPA